MIVNCNKIILKLLRDVSSASCRHLSDSFGRKHDYLRLSLTERCNLRCSYCMPEEGIQLTRSEDCLSFEELKRISSLFVKSAGIRKIRLTGGEPTIYKNLIPLLDFLQELRVHGLETIAMTTNGLTLKRFSKVYKSKGLDRVNISLDTLRKERFEKLTKRKGWDLVYAGLMSAIEDDYQNVKLNCVVLKGFNDDEVMDFARLAVQFPVQVRFIEFMPFSGNKWNSEKIVPGHQLLSLIREKYPDLSQVKTGDKSDVGKVFKDPRMLGSVGFISSMTDNFCSGCNRLRITSDGHLKVCLFGREELSVRDLMRNGATDEEILQTTSIALQGKKKQHAGAINLQKETLRPMIKIADAKPEKGQVHAEQNQLFSHLNDKGEVNMVNVSPKNPLQRVAVAKGKIRVGMEVLRRLDNHSIAKGDVFTTAKLAAVMAAKKTSQLIPLCHQISLSHIEVQIESDAKSESIIVTAKVEAIDKTGVEMESLTAVSIALLTIYDMCKSVTKDMNITDVRLVSKSKSMIEG